MSPVARVLVLTSFLLAATLSCAGEDSAGDGSTDATTPPDSPTTTSGSELTVEKVLAWMDATYPGSAPTCDNTGRLAVGDIFACDRPGPPAPGSTAPIEFGGWVIYVLDETGRAAWNSATDIPSSTDGLRSAYDRAPKGLLCRDLLDEEVDAYPFRQLSTPRVDYFWSLVYWSLEGRPDRMDADGDGVPCETLYDDDVVSDVLAGGPVP